MLRPSEVVVIGSGIIGSSIAYYLAKAGMEVTLIDQNGPIAAGTATQACAGGVRHQGRLLSEIPLAILAIDLWKNLEEELEADLDFRQDGMTVVTDEEASVAVLEQRVEREQSAGLDVRMVYAPDLQNMIPGLSPAMHAGSYCPVDAHANPMRAVAALIAGAVRDGGRVRHRCSARRLLVEKNRVTAVRTEAGDIPCRMAVLAAGAWSKDLATTAGIALPFFPVTLQMMVTAPRPHALDQVLAWLGHGISLKQVPNGGYVIGGGWPAHSIPDAFETRLMAGSMAKSARTTVQLFPSLTRIPVVRAWAGIEAFGVDEMQALGFVPGLEGLFLATGFSGHGFGIGPGVGALTAQSITSGRMPELFQPFTMERFTRGNL